MIQIARVLCPIDFSDFSRRALDHAAAIAGWYEARLTVLYVFPNLAAMDLPALKMEGKDREQILGDMKRFTAHLPPAVALDLRVEEASDVHREILAQARALPADLLVIGAHGRSGFERLILGSVTEKLIRKASCPTMVVPRRAHDVPADEPVRFRNILCPIDFSEGARRALSYALNMAEEADAKLTLLHAIEFPPELRAHPMLAEIDVDQVRAATEAESLQRLRELIPESAKAFCTVKTSVREGAAHREILKEAAGLNADLIVMGVQGRGAVDLLLFGSNTVRVTRAATCPVLIVGPE
jgi:nucleotide-binding universal stress UspA family protein